MTLPTGEDGNVWRGTIPSDQHNNHIRLGTNLIRRSIDTVIHKSRHPDRDKEIGRDT